MALPVVGERADNGRDLIVEAAEAPAAAAVGVDVEMGDAHVEAVRERAATAAIHGRENRQRDECVMQVCVKSTREG